ncbi:arylsulfatase [Methanobacterium petrolearium]|uniref:arylsulfatase n=1 Tax=Methanobacterium petrolearium TaxID=710190 RepID=UPI001AE9B5C7|nr:sulfatase-like hydrolase/transferase [Methanobacterium petrolearium]MBP1945884.1 arylsulfatase [Methanobacterium petrolearium]
MTTEINDKGKIVIVAAYQDIEKAENNFDQLTELAKDKQIKTDGMIIVENNEDDKLRVRETGDSLGRKGLGWGGSVGLLVGLAAPPLLASVAVGAAAGGLIGKFTKKKLESGIGKGLGENLKPGTAAILTIVEEKDKLIAEQALTDSPAKSVASIDKKGLKGLKDALAEAGGKFNPDRTVLPIPDREFGGTAGRTLHESVADWTMIPGPQAPEDAPNVLLILIDDAGFGNIGSFGGPINTPNFSRVQEMGITYNSFHVTAVCSPTRACLLTGRNQHRVGFGSIAEYSGPFPGYTAAKPKSCAAFPRVLKENGYVTGGFGKWHLTPDNVQGAAGPFDHWPQAWGFDHWWGFLSGAAGQYDPIITQDNATIGVPEGKDGEQYYFPDDITDKAVEWLHAVRAQDAHKPWMMYYSTGCAHAPHHVAKQWADKYKGQFDEGWDVLREKTLKRQKELGIVPENTQLTERPDLFPAWDSLSENERKLYARQMEVYSGYSENADWNVGRLLDEIEEMGDLDNTLIIYIWGDNGASMEGTLTGSFNEMTFLNGIVLDAEDQLKLIEEYGGIDAIGGIHTAPHYAAAWAHAGNTPFQWGKQMASHLGGTRNPMVIAWPNKIKPDSQMRPQFTHAIDVGPTILETIGLPEPKMVDGIEQEPTDGTSFAYTFDDMEAEERHTIQYFEMFGSRALYKDGWWAASKPDRIPWDLSLETLQAFGPDSNWDPDKDAPWELYYLPEDFSQAHDVAADNPDKVKELQDLWWEEAERNRVLPLMGGLSVFYGILPPLPTITRYNFAGDVQNVQRGMVPRIYGRSYAIEAELSVPEEGAEGVIVANADFIGGFGLWVDGEGLLHHTYSMLGVETYRQTSKEKIPSGDVKIKMLFEADEPKPGTGGHVTLFANGKEIGSGKMPKTVAVTFSSYAGMDIGRDNGLVVDRDYEDKAPYAFTGTVKKVVFDLKPNAHEDEEKIHEIEQQSNIAHGSAG